MGVGGQGWEGRATRPYSEILELHATGQYMPPHAIGAQARAAGIR